MSNNNKKSPRLAYAPRGPPMSRNGPPRGSMSRRPHPNSGQKNRGQRPSMDYGRFNNRPSMSNSPRMSRPSMGGYGGRGPPRMSGPPGGANHGDGPNIGGSRKRGRSIQNNNGPNNGGLDGERLSLRRYGYGNHRMPGPSPTPSPRDGPGLTPRHPSFSTGPSSLSNHNHNNNNNNNNSSNNNNSNVSAPRFPPRPPKPPKPPQNTKKTELLSAIEGIDLKIAQKEQQLEVAEEHKDLLQRSISTGTSVSELTRNDSGAGSETSSSQGSSRSSSTLSTTFAGFVNDLTPTKLSLSEIVASTLQHNRQRAFASRAILTKFVDDGTETTSTIRGLPTLKRINEAYLNAKAMAWTTQDEQSLPLYATPQGSPTWEDVIMTHEKNKRMVR